jgi:glucose-1-phosphate thymidylyltransferase
LPVGRYPMVYHAIFKLRECGIRDILIVTGREHMGDVVNLLGSGAEFGVAFTYKVQDQAGGIAEALGLAEAFTVGEPTAVILGDNVFSGSIVPHAQAYERQGRGARILIKEVEDPERYGVPELDGGRIVSIEEKPAAPKSRFAVTGIYFYDANVFDIVRGLTRSARGELEITDVNNAYIARGELYYDVLDGWWTDAGTLPSFAKANAWAADVEFDSAFGRKVAR